MHSRAPQAVFIDWYLTLSKTIFWERLAQQDDVRYELLSRALFETLQPRLADWMRGGMTSEQMMALVAQDTCLSYDFVWAEFVRSCQSPTFISPEVSGLVAELRRRGARVIIATDSMDAFSRFTVPAMGLLDHFDDVLNSWELKALKDDIDADGRSLFFQDYLTRHNLMAEQCVLIDDSLETADTCGKIGMAYRLVTAERPLVQHLRGLLEI